MQIGGEGKRSLLKCCPILGVENSLTLGQFLPPNTEKKRATPRITDNVQKTHFIHICLSGAQGCYVDNPLSSGSLPAVALAGLAVPLPRYSFPCLGCCQPLQPVREGLHPRGLEPQAAHTLAAGECSGPHVCALISEAEKGTVWDLPCCAEPQHPQAASTALIRVVQPSALYSALV